MTALALPLPDYVLACPPPTTAELWHVLGTVLEIVDGHRPAGQLDELLPTHRQAPLLRALENRTAVRRKLLSVHASLINREVVELCASVSHGKRVRALAARMELTGPRWRFVNITLL